MGTIAFLVGLIGPVAALVVGLLLLLAGARR